MWRLDNRTPYASAQSFWRDPQGVPHWLVCVRASFQLGADGSLQLSAAQPALLVAAECFDDSSLRYDAEVGPLKPTTELLLHASAYAPKGEPAEQVRVGLRLAALSKQLVVFGARQYTRTGTTRPEAFVRCPIRYQDAYGGSDGSACEPRNPVGRGFAVDRERLIGRAAHRIEYATGDVAEQGPAGFGPIAAHWQPRCAQAGTYDEAWYANKRPLLPGDYDPRCTLSAPGDQCTESYLQGGETIELENLTPCGQLQLRVPRIDIQCSTRVGAERRTHAGKLTSVIIEPDASFLTLVWQSALQVAACELDELAGTIIEAQQVAV